MSFHRCDTVIEHIFSIDITIDIIHLQSIRSKKVSSYICKNKENSHYLNVSRLNNMGLYKIVDKTTQVTYHTARHSPKIFHTA